MAQIIEDGGYGGTSTPGGCTDTPFDLCARMAVMEQALTQLLGIDVTAISLSDISQDLGSVLTGTLGSGIYSGLFANSLFKRGLIQLLQKTNLWFASQQAGTFVFYGVGNVISLNLVALSFAVNKSQTVYRFGAGLYNSGFYYEARVLFNPQSPPQSWPPGMVPKVRFFAGMGAGFFDTSGGFGSGHNSDTPTGTYCVFNYSYPRGDMTWKIMYNDNSAPPPGGADPTPTVLDTGVPIVYYHWYDLKMGADPGGGLIYWEIMDITSGVIATGSFAVPAIYTMPRAEPSFVDSPYTNPNVVYTADAYNAGYLVFNHATGGLQEIDIQHAFAYSVNVDTV